MLVEKGCSLISLANDVKLVGTGLAGLRKDYSDVWQ
jgi:hypothetical protein